MSDVRHHGPVAPSPSRRAFWARQPMPERWVRIREMRSAGWSQKSIATEMGVSPQRVHQILARIAMREPWAVAGVPPRQRLGDRRLAAARCAKPMPERWERIREMRKAGRTLKAIASEFGVGFQRIHKLLALIARREMSHG